jgi:hypothetical protein
VTDANTSLPVRRPNTKSPSSTTKRCEPNFSVPYPATLSMKNLPNGRSDA